MSNVAAEKVQWLWPSRIPLGKLTLLAGEPGLGKSMVAIDAAARVTSGLDWPDETGKSAVGSVMMLALEDDAGDTIRPRLDAAGADVNRVWLLQQADIADGLGRLDAMLERVGDVRLLIIDPVTGFLGKTNPNKECEVRAALTPLVELASRREIAVLCIMHLRKAESARALCLVSGSVAFTAVARAVWMVHAEEDEQRIFVAGKANMARMGKGLRFTIVEPGRVEWLGESDVTAREAFAPQDSRVVGAQQRKAMELMRTFLENGQVPAAALEQHMAKHGISPRTCKRVRKRLGAKAIPPARPGDGPWMVSLPDDQPA